MAFKDKIYASVVSQTKISAKDAQVAGHTAFQLLKSKMPPVVAATFQRMLDSEDGTVLWTMGQVADVAKQTKENDQKRRENQDPLPETPQRTAEKSKTFGSMVREIAPTRDTVPAPAKPTIAPTQVVGTKTLVQKIKSIFLTN